MASCLQYLKLKHIVCWRNNTGATKTEKGGFIRFGATGSPDIFAVLRPNGQLVNIECKVGKNKLSPAQHEWQMTMEAHGAKYWLVYSIDEMIGKLV